MKVRELLTEDRAVSPVIGVILMVAITVILAAVIGTFVLGLGSNVQSTPQVSFSYDFNASVTEVDITHDGGDTLEVGDNTGEVTITSTENASVTWADPATNSSISAGTTWDGYNYGGDGATVRVVWSSSNNESSSTLASQEAPA